MNREVDAWKPILDHFRFDEGRERLVRDGRPFQRVPGTLAPEQAARGLPQVLVTRARARNGGLRPPLLQSLSRSVSASPPVIFMASGRGRVVAPRARRRSR